METEVIKTDENTENTDTENTEDLKNKPKADAIKTEAGIMVLKSRFDEVIKDRNDFKTKLAEIESEKQKLYEDTLTEQNKYKELAEARQTKITELEVKASKVEEMEKTLTLVLDAQIEQVPEQYRSLIPEELGAIGKLTWLSANKELLSKAFAPELNNNKTTADKPDLSSITAEERAIAEQHGVSIEDYLKFK